MNDQTSKLKAEFNRNNVEHEGEPQQMPKSMDQKRLDKQQIELGEVSKNIKSIMAFIQKTSESDAEIGKLRSEIEKLRSETESLKRVILKGKSDAE